MKFYRRYLNKVKYKSQILRFKDFNLTAEEFNQEIALELKMSNIAFCETVF
jgi:hypothetical protein